MVVDARLRAVTEVSDQLAADVDQIDTRFNSGVRKVERVFALVIAKSFNPDEERAPPAFQRGGAELARVAERLLRRRFVGLGQLGRRGRAVDGTQGGVDCG